MADCIHCARCSNVARYIDEYGQLVCGVCPVREGTDSIKFADAARLLKWAREILDGGMMGGSSFEALRNILGRRS